jgi:hypothetical protein
MKLGKERLPEIDIRSTKGLEWLLSGQLYEKKPPLTDDLAEGIAYSVRPQYVRAREEHLGPTRIITEQEVLISAVRRITTGNTTTFNHDFITMAVEPDALDEPTSDIRIYRYWDFVSFYEPTMPPQASSQS